MTAGEAVGLRRLLEAARPRLERNGLRATGRVRLDRLSAEEVQALSGLLGARWRAVEPGATASVDLAAVDEALRAAGTGSSLVAAVQAATGPALVDRRAQRAADERARTSGWEALALHPGVVRHPEVGAWLERERVTGGATRTARAAGEASAFVLLERVLDLMCVLPADPPSTLPRFAARHCDGDPHALDLGRPLDALLGRALSHLGPASDEGSRSPAQARRERYERWGVSCDELSSTVLCLGMATAGDGPLAVALRMSAARGEPRVVTLRELRGVGAAEVGPQVFTCENPDVVAAAADELGAGCPPLVCTEGWPSVACLSLLRAVVSGGAIVLHHGDMDPDGLRIVDCLLGVTGGAPWRMGADDHAVGVGRGAALAAEWRPADTLDDRLRGLADAMRSTGRVVREEQVLDVLLGDLGLPVDHPAWSDSHLG